MNPAFLFGMVMSAEQIGRNTSQRPTTQKPARHTDVSTDAETSCNFANSTSTFRGHDLKDNFTSREC